MNQISFLLLSENETFTFLYLKFCVQFILHLGLLGKKSRRSLNEDKYKLNSKASKKVIFKKKYFFTVEDISPNIG